jgi:hypothetical protein
VELSGGCAVRPSRSRTAWGRRLYPDPKPCESFEEFARSIHADLATMTADDLYRELGLARLRALFDDEPSDWLRQRIPELEAALIKASAKDRR